MPWTETCAMDERKRFVNDWLSGRFKKTELCAAYRVSRPTGDKWIERTIARGCRRWPNTRERRIDTRMRRRPNSLR